MPRDFLWPNLHHQADQHVSMTTLRDLDAMVAQWADALFAMDAGDVEREAPVAIMSEAAAKAFIAKAHARPAWTCVQLPLPEPAWAMTGDHRAETPVIGIEDEPDEDGGEQIEEPMVLPPQAGSAGAPRSVEHSAAGSVERVQPAAARTAAVVTGPSEQSARSHGAESEASAASAQRPHPSVPSSPFALQPARPASGATSASVASTPSMRLSAGAAVGSVPILPRTPQQTRGAGGASSSGHVPSAPVSIGRPSSSGAVTDTARVLQAAAEASAELREASLATQSQDPAWYALLQQRRRPYAFGVSHAPPAWLLRGRAGLLDGDGDGSSAAAGASDAAEPRYTLVSDVGGAAAVRALQRAAASSWDVLSDDGDDDGDSTMESPGAAALPPIRIRDTATGKEHALRPLPALLQMCARNAAAGRSSGTSPGAVIVAMLNGPTNIYDGATEADVLARAGVPAAASWRSSLSSSSTRVASTASSASASASTSLAVPIPPAVFRRPPVYQASPTAGAAASRGRVAPHGGGAAAAGAAGGFNLGAFGRQVIARRTAAAAAVRPAADGSSSASSRTAARPVDDGRSAATAAAPARSSPPRSPVAATKARPVVPPLRLSALASTSGSSTGSSGIKFAPSVEAALRELRATVASNRGTIISSGVRVIGADGSVSSGVLGSSAGAIMPGSILGATTTYIGRGDGLAWQAMPGSLGLRPGSVVTASSLLNALAPGRR